MARKVFISFRFSDGAKYKEKLEELFDGGIYKTVDKKLCYQTSLGDTKLFKIIKKY